MSYTLFNEKDIKELNKITKEISKEDELEFIIRNSQGENLTLSQFLIILNYLKTLDKSKIETNNSLDVILGLKTSNYRISINGVDEINKLMNTMHNRNSNVIFALLLSKIYNQKSSFELIEKVKTKEDTYDLSEFNIRVRKSEENKVNQKKIEEILEKKLYLRNPIFFRYKQRISFMEKNYRIDLTLVKQSKDINQLANSQEQYELEVEYKDKKIDYKFIDDKLIELLKLMEQSNDVISKTEVNKVLNTYYQLIGKKMNNLYSMQAISCEVQHIVDKIANNYSVSDKADGEKTNMLIIDNECYLISNNLLVSKCGIKVKDLDNTLLEGEYLTKLNLFLGFDILFHKKKDIRKESNLENRIKLLNEVILKVNPKSVSINKYEIKNKFDLEKINIYYKKEIKNYFDKLDSQLNQNKMVVFGKNFIFPYGGYDYEVFNYAYQIWMLYTSDSEIKCPYTLDGIILTGINQIYTSDKKDQPYPTYKFKPPEFNSIDVYLEFEKNLETNNFLNVFDNTIEGLPFTNYRIGKLFVGKNVDDKEVPVPFMPEINNDKAYFALQDNEVRDIEGNVVADKTVIELAYNGKSNLPHPYRWSILRTRFDKTEMVRKYQKKYGNYIDVAEKTWNSMKDSLGMDDLKLLSSKDTYENHMNYLRNLVDTGVIAKQRQQDVYYQKITNLAKPMREFHNWIKSLIIYNYCSPQPREVNGKEIKKDVMDISVGRGGDIMKMYHARVNKFVGIDVDYNGIYSSTDGAISRYKTLSKRFPDFTKMKFIIADGTVKYTLDQQIKAIVKNNQDNTRLMKELFESNQTFDVISCQMSLHYMFRNEESVNNLCWNINKFLKKGGLFIATLFDGDKVLELLNNKNNYLSTYQDENGNKETLFEIVKKFNGDNLNDFGKAIDVKISWINDNYLTEYMVSKEFLSKVFKEKSNLTLIDSLSFQELYNLNKDFFFDVVPYEENKQNKIFFDKVKTFYTDQSDINKQSQIYSFLHRYYVFRKD